MQTIPSLQILLEKYLDCRQRSKYYGGRGKSLPQELAQAKIDEANFKKSLDYGIDKLGFGMFESTFSFCENLLNLLIGLSPLLWDTATYYATSYGLVNKDSSLVYTEIIQSAPFLGVVQIINEVIYVWLSLYSTFVLYSMRGILRTKLQRRSRLKGLELLVTLEKQLHISSWGQCLPKWKG